MEISVADRRLVDLVPSRLRSGSRDPSVDDLADIVDTLRSSAGLAGVLSALSADDRATGDLAVGSSWHPLGFAKIHLGGLPDSTVRLRLHVWTRVGYPVAPQDDPHSHRWRFASCVLQGAPLSITHFEESAAGQEFHRFEYAPPCGALRAVGRRSLSTTYRARRRRDELYRCDRGTVHTIQPVDPRLPTATLIARGPDGGRSAPVYRRSDDPTISERPVLTADEVRRLLRLVVPSG